MILKLGLLAIPIYCIALKNPGQTETEIQKRAPNPLRPDLQNADGIGNSSHSISDLPFGDEDSQESDHTETDNLRNNPDEETEGSGTASLGSDSGRHWFMWALEQPEGDLVMPRDSLSSRTLSWRDGLEAEDGNSDDENSVQEFHSDEFGVAEIPLRDSGPSPLRGRLGSSPIVRNFRTNPNPQSDENFSRESNSDISTNPDQSSENLAESNRLPISGTSSLRARPTM